MDNYRARVAHTNRDGATAFIISFDTRLGEDEIYDQLTPFLFDKTRPVPYRSKHEFRDKYELKNKIHLLAWQDAAVNTLPYLGSVELTALMVTFPGRQTFGLCPGYDPNLVCNLIVTASEGHKRRVGAWNMSPDRIFRGTKDSCLYLRGTNNRPFGPELSREIMKLF